MKLNGKSVSQYASKQVVLNRADGESIKLTVRSVPLGWQRRYEEVNPRPTVRGTNIASNSGVKFEPNYNDPAFLKEMHDWNRCESFFLVWLLIKDTPGLAFESTPTDPASLKAFINEFESSGISEIEFAAICAAGREISNPTAEEVANARKDFT